MKRRRLDNRECELLRKIGIINELGFPFTPASKCDARRCRRLLRVACLRAADGGRCRRLLRVACLRAADGGFKLTWRRGEIGACGGKRLWKEGFPIKNKRSRYELNRGDKSPWKRLEVGTAGQILVMNPVTGPTWIAPTGRMKGKGPILTIDDDMNNPVWKTVI